MARRYPDTAEGAEMALHAMADRHIVTGIKAGQAEGEWLLDVIWLPEDRHASCVVYLAPNPMASGPFGADFETFD